MNNLQKRQQLIIDAMGDPGSHDINQVNASMSKWSDDDLRAFVRAQDQLDYQTLYNTCIKYGLTTKNMAVKHLSLLTKSI